MADTSHDADTSAQAQRHELEGVIARIRDLLAEPTLLADDRAWACAELRTLLNAVPDEFVELVFVGADRPITRVLARGA